MTYFIQSTNPVYFKPNATEANLQLATNCLDPGLKIGNMELYDTSHETCHCSILTHKTYKFSTPQYQQQSGKDHSFPIIAHQLGNSNSPWQSTAKMLNPA